MRIAFHKLKDETNQAKHGLSLALARDLDWETALVWVDERLKHNEKRMIALSPFNGIVYFVAVVDRGEL